MGFVYGDNGLLKSFKEKTDTKNNNIGVLHKDLEDLKKNSKINQVVLPVNKPVKETVDTLNKKNEYSKQDKPSNEKKEDLSKIINENLDKIYKKIATQTEKTKQQKEVKQNNPLNSSNKSNEPNKTASEKIKDTKNNDKKDKKDIEATKSLDLTKIEDVLDKTGDAYYGAYKELKDLFGNFKFLKTGFSKLKGLFTSKENKNENKQQKQTEQNSQKDNTLNQIKNANKNEASKDIKEKQVELLQEIADKKENNSNGGGGESGGGFFSTFRKLLKLLPFLATGLSILGKKFPFVANLLKKTGQFLSKGFQLIKKGVKGIVDIFETAGKKIENAIKTVYDFVSKLIKKPIETVKKAYTKTKEFVGKGVNKVKQVGKSAWNGVKSAGSAVKNAGKSVLNGTKQVGKSAWNGLKNLWNGVKSAGSAVKNVGGKVAKGVGGGVATILTPISTGFDNGETDELKSAQKYAEKHPEDIKYRKEQQEKLSKTVPKNEREKFKEIKSSDIKVVANYSKKDTPLSNGGKASITTKSDDSVKAIKDLKTSLDLQTAYLKSIVDNTKVLPKSQVVNNKANTTNHNNSINVKSNNNPQIVVDTTKNNGGSPW